MGVRGSCGSAAGRMSRQTDVSDAWGDSVMDGDGRWWWLWVMAESCQLVEVSPKTGLSRERGAGSQGQE